MKMTSLLLVSAVFVSHLCLCCSRKGLVYCVAPYNSLNNYCADCPDDSTACKTLQYYADNSMFTSDTTFSFLEGDHALSTEVRVTNVSNLSLIGVQPSQGSSKVLCGGPTLQAGFSVRTFNNVRVENLHFIRCSVSAGVNISAALAIQEGSKLNIDHISISNTSGYGLMVSSLLSGHNSIRNSVFSGCHGNENGVGGNTHISFDRQLDSFISNVTMTIENSKFLKGYNATQTTGLYLEVSRGSVHIIITNSLFEGNSALYGANLGIWFNAFSNNYVEIINTTSSYGRSSIGPGVYVPIFLYGDDGPECKPHSLMLLSDVTIVRNLGWGAFTIEDDTMYDYYCRVQYVLVKDSVITENRLTQQNIVESELHCTSVGLIAAIKPFSIDTTLENVSISSGTSTNHHQSLGSACFYTVSNATLINCTFEHNHGSAILSVASNLRLGGKLTFRNNSGINGAGITLLQHSYIFPLSYSGGNGAIFIGNHASNKGGAIYVDGSDKNRCFVQIDIMYIGSRFFFNFTDNTAETAGSSLYLSPINECSIAPESVKDILAGVSSLRNTESDPSAITSDPIRVCSCIPGHQMPDCGLDPPSISGYPGEDFRLHLAVVGFLNGTVPGTVHANFPQFPPLANLGTLQDTQQSEHANCSEFTYTVFFSHSKSLLFQLRVSPNFDAVPFDVHVDLKDCPVGFVLEYGGGTCACDPVFRHNYIQCFINTRSILRPANTWIGFDNSSTTTATGVVFSRNCPYGYCLSRDVNITGDDPDMQCAENRTGTLCGRCVENYSLSLGSQHCWKCSNLYLLILLPLAASGLVLVALLFVLNLTVTEGDINGLIFYANVISMSHSMQYSDSSGKLYTFIAWLNLDLGISTCLYDGMDAYAETWLQFTYPLYLWGIIIAIVVLCNQFPRFAGKAMQNAVKVLATLLLLSYTKLQRTLITIFSFTTLRYPSGAVHYVWLYDANIEYSKGKHLYLFLAGVLVLVLLILPYTVGLTLFQYLQACSGHRVCWWVNKLKPVFDSYAGPYKDRYRMWTGFLLVTRTLLIVILSLNLTGSIDFTHFAILVASQILLVLSSNGVYKNRLHNVLESLFYIQLGVFSGGAIYISLINGNMSALADFSFGSTLVVFLFVTGYRVMSSLKKMKTHFLHRDHETLDLEDEEELLFHEREIPAVALCQ